MRLLALIFLLSPAALAAAEWETAASVPSVRWSTAMVPANYSASPNSCNCGDVCACDPCECLDCPHQAVKESLTVRPPLDITVADRGCPPCEEFKRDALPRLDAAGWVEGVHYRLRVVPFGAETVPTFAYRGSEFARGYSGWPEWRRSLVRAMGDSQGAARKPVSSSGVQDARLRSSPGYHSHKCNSCGTVWSHDGSGDHYREHSCPRCGRYQNVVYQGSQRGTYRPPAMMRRAYYGGCVGCR